MRMNGAQVWILAGLVLTARPSQASRDTECTSWQLDAPTPVADGGIESTQCTCVNWNEYGDPPPPRYDCARCASVPGNGVCLVRGATLPAEGCSHASRMSVLAQAVVLVWLLRRGTQRRRAAAADP